jgi:hypothetical protein
MAHVDTTLEAAERSALRALVDRIGVLAAVAKLGVSREPITRAIAGMPVRRGTIAILRTALDGLNAEAPDAA